ncbi:hypothetical protein [Coleofasciculus sp. E1-EBD-02]
MLNKSCSAGEAEGAGGAGGAGEAVILFPVPQNLEFKHRHKL